MEQNNRSKKIVLGVMLVSAVILTVTGTFAYFVSQTQSTEEKLTVTTGTMKITFADLDGASATINGSLEFGGAPIVKEFKIENTGTEEVTTNILWHNLINTYMYRSLNYKLFEATTADKAYGITPKKTGNVPQSKVLSDKTLAEVTIPGGTTHYYKLEIKLEYLEDVDQTLDINARLVTNFSAGDATVEMVPSIVTSIVENKTPTQYVKSGTPMFNTIATTDETVDGLYEAEDDLGKSYYFRGASENNYVKFANKYWRIIRINGDGSVRMIYDGTVAHKNGEASTDRLTHTEQAYNAKYDDAKYVGWMYGGVKGDASTAENAQKNETDSDIKTVVDDWYKTNIADANLGQYVADAGFCNDRTMPGKDVTKWDADTGLGYAKNPTGYGAFSRFVNPVQETSDGYLAAKESDVNPTLKCSSNDLFTTSSSTKGNKALTYPVGLITIDEASLAGGFYYNGPNVSNNKNYYLYKGIWYWSLSPRSMHNDGYADVFFIYTDGSLSGMNVRYTSGAVAPVISLKAEYAKQFEGYGTMEAPYQIKGVA